jgi:hypothetical protein
MPYRLLRFGDVYFHLLSGIIVVVRGGVELEGG